MPLGHGFTSVVPNGFVFCTGQRVHMCIYLHTRAHTHTRLGLCVCVVCFFSFLSTVSTQSQRLWDYQSPFVFRREPSWLRWGLHWEPSGLYSKQFPLRLPCPLHIVTKAIYFEGKKNFEFCLCLCETLDALDQAPKLVGGTFPPHKIQIMKYAGCRNHYVIISIKCIDFM